MKPEETVRQKTIAALQNMGWSSDRLQWKPEWSIPATPHDLSKRERGQKFAVAGSADLVAFADDSHQSYALQAIFEFKAPNINAGREQLMRYLSMEPMVNHLTSRGQHDTGWIGSDPEAKISAMEATEPESEHGAICG